MAQVASIIAEGRARGPTSGFTDVPDDESSLPATFDRQNAKLFTPLKVGPFLLKHRIVHAALGRSRSAHEIESPLAAVYFKQRTTPGSLVISQATTISPESIPWSFSAGLWGDEQVKALSRTISAVHEQQGIWFHQLTHVGRSTSPALVKRAWEKAGHPEPPPYGYQPVSSSAVAESGINTHSGEPFGTPRPLTLEEIEIIIDNFKSTAKRAVDAGADGIEILSGNGFLLDQFLHDNINHRTDAYGGSVEDRARLTLEIVDKVAEVVGYQRIGIRISPFSNFHETDGSQPLEQLLYLSRELILRGIAYLNVGEPRVSRNLDIEANLQRLLKKGIPPEDISLRQFRILTEKTRPLDTSFTPTRLFGNGGYTAATSLLTVEEGLADGVVFGRRFISNPDLVNRVRLGYPFTPYDRDTFYTHGAQGYITYKNYGETEPATLSKIAISNGVDGHIKQQKKVAIIGAGVSGIVSASAFQRLEGFSLTIFERKSVPGGSWAYDPISSTVPLFPAVTPESIDAPLTKPEGDLPLTVKRTAKQRFHSTPLYSRLRANIPAAVMAGGSTFDLPTPKPETAPYLTQTELSEGVEKKIHEFDSLITYKTTVEDVNRLENGTLRLTLRREVDDSTDYWYEEEFDHLIVATGHNSVPKVPNIKGLDLWKGELRHTVTYRSAEEFRNKSIFIVGSSESAIDVCLQSLPIAKGPIYVSQKSPHPRYPTVFSRPGVDLVSTINRFTENEIILDDGKVIKGVETVVFATGYFYTYPFLSKIRPATDGYRVPGLYQHIFDIYNPNIAFIGVANASLAWLTWEKSAFLAALLWAGKIHLPSLEEQKKWEARRATEKDNRHFHILEQPSERVLYFDELNELASEYLATDATDDILLRSFPFEWVLELVAGRPVKEKFYGLIE